MTVEEFVKKNYETMKHHNLKQCFMRRTTPTIQIFFLLNEYLEADDTYWSDILSKIYDQYGVNASADDDRYWKYLGGDTWGYIPIYIQPVSYQPDINGDLSLNIHVILSPLSLSLK